jgi:D-tyrosyl-tRNA(Tyr) deacylase
MRVVLQRVNRASVTVDNDVVGEIGPGLLLLVGIAPDDDAALAERMARKCAEMRLFAADGGGFERSLVDIAGAALVVPQFTLLADVRKGRRPSFIDAAPPEHAAPLVERFAEALQSAGVRVATGRFGAKMLVESVNDGPVTIIVDSASLERPRR